MVKDGTGGLEMFHVPFTKISACLPYILYCASWLIASVSVYDSPFLDDAVFVLRHYQNSLTVLVPLKQTSTTAFPHVSETLTETFGVWDHYENVVVFVSVPMDVCVAVPLFLTELEVQFGLEPLENQVRVIAPAECCSDVLAFLFQ